MPNKSQFDRIDSLAATHLPELPLEDEERLEKLFTKLDTDGNGKIDIHDLSVALKEFGVHQQYAEVRFHFTNCQVHGFLN